MCLLILFFDFNLQFINFKLSLMYICFCIYYSGLDSVGSLQIVQCLQRMSSLGITIVSAIHQPRSSVFNSFSHVLMLARGKTVYLGPTSLIQKYFVSLGFVPALHENVADWCIDVVCGQIEHRENSEEIECNFVPVSDLSEMWLKYGKPFMSKNADVARRLTDEDLTHTTSRDIGPQEPSSIYEIETRILDITGISAHDEIGTKEFSKLCFFVSGVHDHSGSRIEVEQRCRIRRLVECLENVIVTTLKLVTLLYIHKEDVAEPSLMLHKLFLDKLPQGSTLTAASLALLLVNDDNDSESGFKHQIIDQQSPTTSFISQLATYMTRNAAKFDVMRLFAQCAVAVVGAGIVANTNNGELVYEHLPRLTYSGILILSLITAASNIYVFGDERLIFRRESSTGMSVIAYWLAHNVINLLDISLVTLVYSALWYSVVSPDFSFTDCYGIYLLLAFVCSGIAHFFSVSFDESSATLVAVLLPVVLIAAFGGVGEFLSDMSQFGQIITRASPGYYVTENFVLQEITSLPHYVRYNDEVSMMMHLYSYHHNRATYNSAILLAQGIGWRLLSLLALDLEARGTPGGFWCCLWFRWKS